jgi:alkylhydroperoxidase/carboxymuconolactone decarboxylase family protein
MDKMGCDLRPIDPAHPEAARAKSACCGGGAAAHHEQKDGAAQAAAGGTRSYYDTRDLARFGDIGRFAGAAWEKFGEYYTAATAEDGALTRREKALIGLAVAHAKQCPYCIDAYTAECLERGATPEQMHEAVHVAAALSAGIALAHGVQMQNALRARGAIAEH